MRVQFFVDSGANIHSKKGSGWLNERQLGFTEEEWNALTEDEKWKEAESWANQHIEIWYEESAEGEE